ncbi:MAG: DUF2703 domain-containing protein [Thermodesulfovibrionales bacterium]
MLILKITWQRLLDDENRTCPRCSGTEKELEYAFEKLKEVLKPLGFEVIFEKKEIGLDEFRNVPLSSNQIFINNKPLEDWLGARTGQSQCCDVCGDSECRTIVAGDRVYETIPSSFIIKAGLIAAAEMLPVERLLSDNFFSYTEAK